VTFLLRGVAHVKELSARTDVPPYNVAMVYAAQNDDNPGYERDKDSTPTEHVRFRIIWQPFGLSIPDLGHNVWSNTLFDIVSLPTTWSRN
jgi:hypothetical protein